MRGTVSDHIRSNVWGVVACFLAVMGTAVVASASDAGPEANRSASAKTQIKKLKQKLVGVEQRLAALEGKPGVTIPASLPPSGPASGELAGSYPSPTIGTVSGLDLAESDAETAGINFGADSNLYRDGTNDLQTDDALDVGGRLRGLGNLDIADDALLGTDFTDEVQLFGWLNTAQVTVVPAPGDCDSLGEIGRMVFNITDNILYICDSGSVWRTILAS